MGGVFNAEGAMVGRFPAVVGSNHGIPPSDHQCCRVLPFWQEVDPRISPNIAHRVARSHLLISPPLIKKQKHIVMTRVPKADFKFKTLMGEGNATFNSGDLFDLIGGVGISRSVNICLCSDRLSLTFVILKSHFHFARPI